MINLAIECSGMRGSLAVMNETTIVQAVRLPEDMGTVQSLAPEIRGILQRSGRPDLISVTNGPGSFTGLRVGLATAKMLSLAWNIPVAGVDTLSVIARAWLARLDESQPAAPCWIVPVMNAFRGQVFSAAWLWKGTGDHLQVLPSQVVDAVPWKADPINCLLAASEAIELPVEASEGGWVVGPGLAKFTPHNIVENQDAELPGGWQLADSTAWDPAADWVGRLGAEQIAAGVQDDAFSISPNYLRRSAAEEKAG